MAFLEQCFVKFFFTCSELGLKERTFRLQVVPEQPEGVRKLLCTGQVICYLQQVLGQLA